MEKLLFVSRIKVFPFFFFVCFSFLCGNRELKHKKPLVFSYLKTLIIDCGEQPSFPTLH